MQRAIVFANGELIGDKAFYQDYINQDDIILCADGGAEYAYELDVKPDLIVGDLDSVSKEVLDYYQNQGVLFKKYPTDKDKTDTQLLLEELANQNYDEIIVLAALGGRLDHTLGNIYLMDGLYHPKINIKLVSSREIVEVIEDKKIIKDQINKTISLIPITLKATGVNLSGFKYELEDAIFKRGGTLGLSNIIRTNKAMISIEEGRLLMIINEDN
ncbi:thiamine diphosphokinase [Selenihalanaerobacter shriftii]|uniref:Thiamine diphosphokinase n=1 Tax=Selenihalanaerobacter shriftii TaxID=142842 RepID=A0A1T4LR63_9FIRM|nr:thiamine diphosphokinase [Selenihalanaerobacter shriftii]SJZ57116.1 thiamine pyrophosphokinase [Selenihalanaerobacter shriftii]